MLNLLAYLLNVSWVNEVLHAVLQPKELLQQDHLSLHKQKHFLIVLIEHTRKSHELRFEGLEAQVHPL